MITKVHRRNHDFQIAYFLTGNCHTADGAYAMLSTLKDEREASIAHFKVEQTRTKAKELRARERLTRGDEADKLEAQADLQEIENNRSQGAVLIAAAHDELAFINACIEKVQPLRKYKHLPDAQAHEAMQAEEWKGELIMRAQNFLLCQGSIPADEFLTMRSHPEFSTAIFPAIDEIKVAMQSQLGVNDMLKAKPKFDLPSLMAPDNLKLSAA